MKCPLCDAEINVTPIKRWTFNVYSVSRFRCSECGSNFNLYQSESRSYTIPKARR
ncbi:MAG TPA: hypothetical protein VKU79_07115 [Thermoplasmataceae archaeon]|nr:hypothetical protein [Thermoplasmatales archaeon AK]HLH86615.1 hypothetical protein [Thermoplasmataceae archaeon]